MTMHYFTTTFSLFIGLLFTACATVHQSEGVLQRAHNHQLIAVLPPEVVVTALKKDSSAESRVYLQQLSDNFQRQVYTWLLDRTEQHKLSVKVQDVSHTRELLNHHGYYDGKTLTTKQLCTILEVDAVLSPYFELDQPMSAGGVAMLSLATRTLPVRGVTNSIYADLELYDQTTETPFWDYSMTINGTVGSIPAELVDRFMKKASAKIPYAK